VRRQWGLALARPGEEIVTAREAHAGWHEIAAAALHGVEHHRARLAEDHANARRLAALLA
jgi:hypothetical protein